MEKLLTRLGLGLGALALVIAAAQYMTIGSLEDRLDTLAAQAPDAAPVAEPLSGEAYDDSQLRARIAALETKLARERAMSKAVARASTTIRPRAVVPTTEEGDTGEVVEEVTSLREDVDALLTGAGVQSSEGKKQIKDLVGKLRKEERAERTARWTEFRNKRDAELVKTFAEDAGLDEEQATGLSTILSSYREAQMKLRSGMRDGTTSFEDMRTKRKELRAQTNDKLAGVLDDTQLEDFKAKMAEGRRGRRGGL